jgi:hypothetical protein
MSTNEKTAKLIEKIGQPAFAVHRYALSPAWDGFSEALTFHRRNPRNLRMETVIFGVAGREDLSVLLATNRAKELAQFQESISYDEALKRSGYAVVP